MILQGERDLRRTIGECLTHYHAERTHQRIGNELLQPLDRAKARDAFGVVNGSVAC